MPVLLLSVPETSSRPQRLLSKGEELEDGTVAEVSGQHSVLAVTLAEMTTRRVPWSTLATLR